MNRGQSFNGFDFYHHEVRNQDIDPVTRIKSHSLILDRQPALSSKVDPTQREFST